MARAKRLDARGDRTAARLRVLPHAGAHRYRGRPAARSQLPRPASRPVGKARHAECLHDCHADKSAQWAASAVETGHGADRKGWQKYAEAFHSAWTGQADAAALLGGSRLIRTPRPLRGRARRPS